MRVRLYFPKSFDEERLHLNRNYWYEVSRMDAIELENQNTF